MGSSTEIAFFEGDALTMILDDAGEEVCVPELAPDFIGVDVEWEEDSSEQVEGDGQNDQEPEKEGTSALSPVEETNESQPSQPPQHIPTWYNASNSRRKSGSVDSTNMTCYDSLSLEANINEEMEKLKKENARLRKRENIVVSPWFLEKFDTLALVESQIKVRTERFIAAIDLLKKRTKEAEFYSRQAAVLQNILVDNEISLPILEDLDPDDEAKERAAAEEYLLRINDQDWEIIDLKDKLSQFLHKLRVMGCSGVIKPSGLTLRGQILRFRYITSVY
ncbi:OLC1v1039267C1 [Oldenlandia corymbosa var. corymbosa]|uniref:OLC1v1039267C1 n=1 Tax=Oldenlandia corymbosa var. corymbosa TaxID=529605 RepID=A0AAV1D5C8_OLDCO|nr:OLC1v1039267C1 [Oldenlandia corymbosa var. corymbosa]